MAKRTVKLDSFNKQILTILHKQADISNQDLADKVGLSPSACFQRKKALQEAGYFFNFYTEMDLSRLCEHVLAYVEFYLESNKASNKAKFEAAIMKIPEFMDCLQIAGNVDYISFSCFSDLASLQSTCDDLSAREELGIKRIEIKPIMSRAKWFLGYPIEKLKWLDEQS